MLEEDKKEFYQVEMNLFSASLGSVAQGTRAVHSSLNKFLDNDDSKHPVKIDNIGLVCRGLCQAAIAYGKWKEAVIITVTDDIANAFDQDIYIEFFAEKGIKNVRYSFAEVVALTEFDEETGIIRV